MLDKFIRGFVFGLIQISLIGLTAYGVFKKQESGDWKVWVFIAAAWIAVSIVREQ